MKKLLLKVSVLTLAFTLMFSAISFAGDGSITTPPIPVDGKDVIYYPTPKDDETPSDTDNKESENPSLDNLPSGKESWEGEKTPFDTGEDEKTPGGESKTQKTTLSSAKKTANKKTVKKPTLKSAKKKGKVLTVKWKKVSGVTGYQIQYSLKKNMKGAKTVTVKGAKKKSRKIKKLKKNKKYYVRLRAYKGNGKNRVYSKWTKKIKTAK